MVERVFGRQLDGVAELLHGAAGVVDALEAEAQGRVNRRQVGELLQDLLKGDHGLLGRVVVHVVEAALELLGDDLGDFAEGQVEAGKAMGAYIYETVFQLVLPQVLRRYVAVALRMLARALTEGVAILLVLSAYSNGADTLATALMRALGVTGDNAQAGWVLLLATLMLMLVLT